MEKYQIVCVDKTGNKKPSVIAEYATALEAFSDLMINTMETDKERLYITRIVDWSVDNFRMDSFIMDLSADQQEREHQ